MQRTLFPDDFTTVLRLTQDLGVRPRDSTTTNSDITPAIDSALSNNGDSTLIMFDMDGAYEASGNVTPPANIDSWGLYAPSETTVTIYTPNSVPQTSVKEGLFGGYIIERGTQTASAPAMDIVAESSGTAMEPAKNAGRVDIAPTYIAEDGTQPSAMLAAERESIIYTKRLSTSGSAASNPTRGIHITAEHKGHIEIADSDIFGYPIGIGGAEATGSIHITDGFHTDNIHSIRLSGTNTSVDGTEIEVLQPNGAGIVWDAGTTYSSGGEIRDCDISVNGGRSAIAAAERAGGCTIHDCTISYETGAESGVQTGAVIDAPSPIPSSQGGESGELVGTTAWETHGTTITGNGEPTAAIWLTDRPDSKTRTMNIQLKNADGIVYDGTTTGRVEDSIINVWGTPYTGEMVVSNVDEVATPGGEA